MLPRILLALLAIGLASAARQPALEPTTLAVTASSLYTVTVVDVNSTLRASVALPAEFRGPLKNVLWPQYLMDGLAVAQACRASGRLAAAQPKRLLTLAVQESNSTGFIGLASAPSRFQVIQTTAACNANTPVVPKPARELQLLIQGVPGTSTAGMFLIAVCAAGQSRCIVHRVTALPPPPTVYFEPIALAKKPTGPSFDVSSNLLSSAQLPAALRGDNSVFAWYNLDASVVVSVCRAYKPRPRAPKMLARTTNRQGTVVADTTLQVLDVNSPACGPTTTANGGVPQKELHLLLSSPSGKGPVFTLMVCAKGARRCTAYRITPSVEGLQSATQDAYLQSLGESALGGSNNKILPRFVTRFGNMCLVPTDDMGGRNGVELKFSSNMDACSKHTMTFTDKGSVKHEFSGRCLHIQNGGAIDGSRVVLWDDCGPAERLAWRATADGTLQHVQSGAFVTPDKPDTFAFMSWDNGKWTGHMGTLIGSWGGKCLAPAAAGNASGMGVVLRSGACNFAQSTDAFVLQPDGCVRHIATGRCLHVQSGGNNVPPEDDPVVLWDDCTCYAQERLRWTLNEVTGVLVHRKSGKVLGALNADGSYPPEGARVVLRTGLGNALRQATILKRTFRHAGQDVCWAPVNNGNGARVTIIKAQDTMTSPNLCASHTWVLSDGRLKHMESGLCARVVAMGAKYVELASCSEENTSWRVYGNGGLQNTGTLDIAGAWTLGNVLSKPMRWAIRLDLPGSINAQTIALVGMV